MNKDQKLIYEAYLLEDAAQDDRDSRWDRLMRGTRLPGNPGQHHSNPVNGPDADHLSFYVIERVGVEWFVRFYTGDDERDRGESRPGAWKKFLAAMRYDDQAEACEVRNKIEVDSGIDARVIHVELDDSGDDKTWEPVDCKSVHPLQKD